MKKIVGFCGTIGSGKDTAAKYLIDNFGYQKVSFAEPLKDAVSIIFGWDRMMVDGSTDESRKWREEVDPWWSKKLGWNVTPRSVLQKMGTEAGRDVFGKDIWVSALMRKIENSDHDKFVISDVRFANEIKAVREQGGTVIGLVRSFPDWWYSALSANAEENPSIIENAYPDVHISEWNWVGRVSDMIYNDQSIEYLYQMVKSKLNQ